MKINWGGLLLGIGVVALLVGVFYVFNIQGLLVRDTGGGAEVVEASEPAVPKPVTAPLPEPEAAVEPESAEKSAGPETAQASLSAEDFRKMVKEAVEEVLAEQGQPATQATDSASEPAVPSGSSGQTELLPRECLIVNGVQSCLDVQNPGDIRDLFTTQTGIATGKEYQVNIPEGWLLGVACVSVHVAPEVGEAADYAGSPMVIIRGPWRGTLGAYEAGLHGTIVEWEDYLTGAIYAAHRRDAPNGELIFLP